MTKASGISLLTLQEFRARYGGLKPYYEYWNGEAVQKSVPTVIHGLIQTLIALLLKEAGYKAGTEIELRIDNNWQPVPDVIGFTMIELPYPTKPVEVVVEILAPDDRFNQVLAKCENYARIGIPTIVVIDPEMRLGYIWISQEIQLKVTETVALPHGAAIEVAEIWRRLAAELE